MKYPTVFPFFFFEIAWLSQICSETRRINWNRTRDKLAVHCFARNDRWKIVSTIEDSRSLWSHAAARFNDASLRLYTRLSNVPTTQRVHIKVVVQVLRCAFGNFCLVFDDTVLKPWWSSNNPRENSILEHQRARRLSFFFSSLLFFTRSRTQASRQDSFGFWKALARNFRWSRKPFRNEKKRTDCWHPACRTVDRISDSFPFCSSRFRYRP